MDDGDSARASTMEKVRSQVEMIKFTANQHASVIRPLDVSSFYKMSPILAHTNHGSCHIVSPYPGTSTTVHIGPREPAKTPEVAAESTRDAIELRHQTSHHVASNNVSLTAARESPPEPESQTTPANATSDHPPDQGYNITRPLDAQRENNSTVAAKANRILADGYPSDYRRNIDVKNIYLNKSHA